MKVIINNCFGGYSFSKKALNLYNKTTGKKLSLYDICKLPRTDSVLVSIVEKLGKEANGKYASLKIIEIPDDVNWYIEENDGCEHIAEVHRRWY